MPDGTWPNYPRIRRYWPGRRFGPVFLEIAPAHLPWPQVSLYRCGDRVALGFQVGPLGPDPVFSVRLTVLRPGSRARA
jgi:hypothetical protein